MTLHYLTPSYIDLHIIRITNAIPIWYQNTILLIELIVRNVIHQIRHKKR